MLQKFMFYMCLLTASIESTVGNKTRFFLVSSTFYQLTPHFRRSVPERLRSRL